MVAAKLRGACVCVAALLEDTTPTPDELDCGTTDAVLGDEAVLAELCWGGA